MALAALAAALPLAAPAATFRVDGATGTDSGSCGSEVSPCDTIQQAVNNAASGDTVLVAEGTYVDTETCGGDSCVVCVNAKEITILGGFSGGNWSLPDPAANTTVIDGQDARRGIVVIRGGSGGPPTTLRLEGFTIQNGLATGAVNNFGGGLKTNFADVVLRDVIFQDNVAIGGSNGQGGGAGAAIQATTARISTVALERVRFLNNDSTGGTLVSGNTNTAAVGGGLQIDHAVVTGFDVVLQGNTATGGGSATTGKDGLGGGAAFMPGTTGTIQKLTATGNTALGGSGSTDGGGAFGGGIFLEGKHSPTADPTSLTILDSTFTGNAATGGNGPTDAGGGIGAGMDVFNATLVLERSTVIDNHALAGTENTGLDNTGGGGVFLEWTSTSTAPLNVIRDSVIADNTINGSQGGGGGLRLLGARAQVEHSTFVDNRILGIGFGNGILVGPRVATSKPSELTLSYSIVADHTVAAGSRALHVQLAGGIGSTATLTDPNLFRGNNHDTNSGEANSGTFVGSPSITNGAASDFFVNPAGFDYHVDGTSPPTDSAGGSSQALDLDGATRTGTRDLGADEFGAVAHGLSVAKAGVGTGTVTSSPGGINCGSTCFAFFAGSTSVTLNASPDGGFFFTGWSGDADCSDGSVLMNQDVECVAQFEDVEPPPPVCTVGDDTLVLTAQTVNNTVVEEACISITAGPSYTVGSTGDVTFHAPSIILKDGFVVEGAFVAISGVP